jgi:hypothetical protein
VPAGAAERLLVALEHSGRPEAHAPLHELARRWTPHDPGAAQALSAAVAACAPEPAAR